MNVLIADDESTVLAGLKCIIDWRELGFTICAEARNGEDALKKIMELNPDLVLMDIRMPKLTGIEVVKLAREQGFFGKIIILSGVSDFKHAQTAMRYGVDFYLTKPIDEEELENSVKTIGEDLKKEKHSNSALKQYQEKAKDTILRDLLVGKEEVSSAALDELNLLSNVYQIVVYENYNQETFYTAWNFEELLRVTNRDNNSFEHLRFEEKEVILLKGDFALERFEALLKHYDLNPEKGSPLDSLFLTYGRRVYKSEQITFSYQDTCKLLERRFFCDQNQHILSYLELPKETAYGYSIKPEESERYFQVFLDSIKSNNRTMIVETLKQLEENLYYAVDNETCIKYFLGDIYLQVKQSITYAYSTIDIPFPTNTAIFDFVQGKYYLYEIIQFLSEQFEMCMKAIGNTSGEGVLDDIIHYVNHNFKETIKLESIAPLFGYNSSYLGKLFHKKMGESFHSFVDSVRIEHSKKLLLNETLKVYEIAELVGYSNVDYFHKKFKKYVGISPEKFRKSDTEE